MGSDSRTPTFFNGEINRVYKFSGTSRPTEHDYEKIWWLMGFYSENRHLKLREFHFIDFVPYGM